MFGRRSTSFTRSFAMFCAAACALVGIPAAVVTVTASPAAATATHDDTVFAFGAASFNGSTQGWALAKPVRAMATAGNGVGYWLAAEDGGVFGFGGAHYYGGMGGTALAAPVVGITSTPSGHGYWLVGADGGVFGFGDAHFYGTAHGWHLNAPVTALVATPDGGGYWLIALDGGVFAFGNAHFRGSAGNWHLNAPVVGMAAAGSNDGYWLVGADGGIFGFGNAHYYGSAGSWHLNAPVVGMASSSTGAGYWLVANDGGVFSFGDAQFKFSAVGTVPKDKHAVSISPLPTDNGYRLLALPFYVDVAQQGPGASGAATVDLQNRLASMGYWLPGTGVYDALTTQAVYAFQKWNGLARTGVVDGATQVAFRNAKRPTAHTGSGYWIEVDKTRQVLLFVSNGHVNWIFNASSGSDHPYTLDGARYGAHTPEGTFTVIRSVNGPDHGPLGTLYRPRYFTWSGIAVHGYTSVPPYPASHGCVRVSNAAMDFIWAANLMPIGASVWVYL